MSRRPIAPPRLPSRPVSRRRLLRLGARLGGALALGALPFAAHGGARRLGRLAENPFRLGVASGDPTPGSVVLWTRLDRDALARAGAERDAVEAVFEVAADANFSRIARRGAVAASPELGHSAHADVRGLEPDTVYHYRWLVGGAASPVGRTRTAPAAHARNDAFRFAFASCQHYEHGYYTAYRHMAREELDLIVHLGDYIYEYGPGGRAVAGRVHEGPEVVTLDDYRARYATYRGDPDLQAAHAAAPWVATWDDHEVDNNYAADIAEDGQTPERLLARRAAAYQAFYEFMPVRLPAGRRGPDMPIHRPFRFGRLLEMHVLDTRQYRSDQACGDGRSPDCDGLRDPGRTLLGQAQKRWLFRRLAAADAAWNVLAQQVMMAGLRSVGGNGETLRPMDAWDGYPHERRELLELWDRAGTPNPVVITGDAHSNWASDLKLDFDDESSKTVGAEFVGTSISSGGDGQDAGGYGAPFLPHNPHVKFHNAQRGYVTVTVTPELWRGDFKVLPRVTTPGAPIGVRRSCVVEAGRPGVRTA